MASRIRKRSPRTVDEYIDLFTPLAQVSLRNLHRVLTNLQPTAEEKMRYQVPALFYKNEVLISWSGHQRFYNVFLVSERVKEELALELVKYDVRGRAIRVPYGFDVPATLLKKMVTIRKKEIG